MQNSFPCLLGKNIHLRIFFQLQSYLPEDKYFHLGCDYPLKISIYSESADIPLNHMKASARNISTPKIMQCNISEKTIFFMSPL